MVGLTRRVDWRRALIYTHRWLGITGCLVFLMWFVSGVVMMYQRMPRLSAEERLARMPVLDVARIAVNPGDAARRVGLVPERVRVSMLLDRPIYRFENDGEWTAVHADTGEPLGSLSLARALAIVRQLYPEHAATAADAGYVASPDQWLLDGGLSAFLPMRRVSLGDDAETQVYVSERTGEPVMKTTRRGRVWGYLGAVLHWTYFTPFRTHREVWRYSIIAASFIGAVMCLSGLAIGVWRFSPSARFRLKRERSHSPYAGLAWWHHYAGLAFGFFSFTWALSGALSLTPFDWTPWFDPLPAQQAGIRGGEFRLAMVGVNDLRLAIRTIASTTVVKDVELTQFQGRLFASAYQPPPLVEALAATNPDVSAAFSPALALGRRSVWLDSPAGPTFDRLPARDLEAAARAAMPNVSLLDVRWLERYDAYYYDRSRAKPLPVLWARYADQDRTWLYLDPASGSATWRVTTRSRVNRWLYNGLHSFDFPFLYPRRPLWDVVLLVLSIGGIGVTVTAMVPAWRRLKRHARA